MEVCYNRNDIHATYFSPKEVRMPVADAAMQKCAVGPRKGPGIGPSGMRQ